MTGPQFECNHAPICQNTMWHVMLERKEKNKAEEEAVKQRDQPGYDLLADPEFAARHAEFAVELDQSDSPFTNYQQAVNAACESIAFEEIFVACLRSGIIVETERPISSWRGDSNKFMCPDPSHDNGAGSTFSAWGSKDKNNGRGIWTCAKGCGEKGGDGGGDKFTLAKYLYSDWNFHEVCNRLALDFRGVRKPEIQISAPPIIEEAKELEVPIAVASPVVVIDTDLDDLPEIDTAWMGLPELEKKVPSYEWKDVLGISPYRGSFLELYCHEVDKDTTPSEFNLFNAIVAMGMVAGNNVICQDFTDLTMNFGVCLIAPSGGGKSRSVRHAMKIIHDIWPWNGSIGINIMSGVASGQRLVNNFISRVDPADPTGLTYPVRGLIEYDEFSTLAKNADAKGSQIKETLHQLLDHAPLIEYSSQAAKLLRAVDPFGSILTATQTSRVSELFTKSDATSGFINRMLFVTGKRKKQLHRGKIQLDFMEALDSLKGIRSWCQAKRIITWEEDADKLFLDFFERRIQPLKEADQKDLLTRIDLNIKKLILAFACNEKSSTIRMHHVRMAMKLFNYIVDCYGFISGNLVVHESNKVSEWCHEQIQTLEARKYQAYMKKFTDAGKEIISMADGQYASDGTENEKIESWRWGVTPNDLKNYKKKGWEQTVFLKALRELTESGLIWTEKGPTRVGPKTTYYHCIEAA